MALVTTVVQVQSLTWEHAVGAVKKKKERTNLFQVATVRLKSEVQETTGHNKNGETVFW